MARGVKFRGSSGVRPRFGAIFWASPQHGRALAYVGASPQHWRPLAYVGTSPQRYEPQPAEASPARAPSNCDPLLIPFRKWYFGRHWSSRGRSGQNMMAIDPGQEGLLLNPPLKLQKCATSQPENEGRQVR